MILLLYTPRPVKCKWKFRIDFLRFPGGPVLITGGRRRSARLDGRRRKGVYWRGRGRKRPAKGADDMTASQRRKAILEELARAEGPVSAGTLAGRFGVSRQVIVGENRRHPDIF